MFIVFSYHFSVTSLETVVSKINVYYFFHIYLITESYKHGLFEKASIYLVYELEIFTDKITKSSKEGTRIRNSFSHAKILVDMA